MEHIVAGGSASPWHVHLSEDESFYVVSGAKSVKVEGLPRARLEAVGPSRVLLMTGGPAFASLAGD